MDHTTLIESFSEFKEFKNIDKATMMSILEDIFRAMIIKTYGTDENFDIIIVEPIGAKIDRKIFKNKKIQRIIPFNSDILRIAQIV